MRLFLSMLDRLFVIVGALLGVQIPLFMQQYMQRLAGHVAELNRVLNNLRELAFQSNKTLEEYIAKFLANPDLDFSRQGEFMLGVESRWRHLSLALENMSASSIWMRPYLFLRDLQPEIAKPVFYSFEPGLNLTLEGLAYAVLGAVLGFCLYQALCKGVSAIFHTLKSLIKRIMLDYSKT
ncbi:MAG: DUF2937 family protein [Chlamydiales bacterium]